MRAVCDLINIHQVFIYLFIYLLLSCS